MTKRAMLARISTAVLVQTKGFGASLYPVRYRSMAASSWRMLRWTAPELLLRQQGEPPLDQIDPGRALGDPHQWRCLRGLAPRRTVEDDPRREVV
jgi:hypothetical protein